MLLFVSQANTLLNLDGHVSKEQQINKPKVNGNIFFCYFMQTLAITRIQRKHKL